MAITGIGTSQDYGAGAIHTFTAPYSGLYKFECWGAQGGNYGGYAGGYGGYVYGHKVMNAGDTLYICVGTQAGYNGGGSGSSGGNGGGATCVSTTSGGTLANSLLVAGGGGGANVVKDYWGNDRGLGRGGHGGGVSGLNGQLGGESYWYDRYIFVATPTSAGGAHDPGGGAWSAGTSIYARLGVGMSGGKQSNGAQFWDCGGGGGGRYGGGTLCTCPGGGGSAYVGGMPAVTFNGKTYSYGYNGSRSGNGYARVTLVDISSNLYVNETRVDKIMLNDTQINKVIYNETTVFG